MTKIHTMDLKDQAKRLRSALQASGKPVSHAQALELVAKQNGYRDWNTASAMAPDTQPAPFTVGSAISGTYLGKPFTGQIKGVAKSGDLYRITAVFDEPVDVVQFESFSNYRRQVTALLDKTGVTPQKTSDGTPHMQLSA